MVSKMIPQIVSKMIPKMVPKMIPKMDPKYPHKMKSAADKTPACRGFVIGLFVLGGYSGSTFGIIFWYICLVYLLVPLFLVPIYLFKGHDYTASYLYKALGIYAVIICREVGLLASGGGFIICAYK